MSSQLIYRFISGFYDLLDIVYFRKYASSPRRIVFEAIAPKDRVLDLCTGTATNAIAIAGKYPEAEVTGVDLSDSMLTIARNKTEREALGNIHLMKMDAAHMNFAQSSFDKILLSLVLHEVDEELAAAILREAIRVLRPDGELIVTEWERPRELRKKLLFWPIQMLEPKPYRTFIRKDLVQYFRQFGLETAAEIHCDYSKVLRLRKQRAVSSN